MFLFRLKKTVVHKQEKILWIMKKLNSCAKSRKLSSLDISSVCGSIPIEIPILWPRAVMVGSRPRILLTLPLPRTFVGCRPGAGRHGPCVRCEECCSTCDVARVESSNIVHAEHAVRASALQTANRQQSGDIIPHAVIYSLALLNMGKELPETCWAIY